MKPKLVGVIPGTTLYRNVFGENRIADVLLAALGLVRDDFGRYRDAFISEGRIAVYTRIGGGNREAYEPYFGILQAHPQYAENRDDDFDSTYCTFFFTFPPEHAAELQKLDRGEKFDPSARWKDAIDKINGGGNH